MNGWRKKCVAILLLFALQYKVFSNTFLTNKPITIIPNKRLIGIVLTVVILLLIPLIAMQFTAEVAWTQSGFLAAGVLLPGTGLLCELVLRNVKKNQY